MSKKLALIAIFTYSSHNFLAQEVDQAPRQELLSSGDFEEKSDKYWGVSLDVGVSRQSLKIDDSSFNDLSLLGYSIKSEKNWRVNKRVGTTTSLGYSFLKKSGENADNLLANRYDIYLGQIDLEQSVGPNLNWKNIHFYPHTALGIGYASLKIESPDAPGEGPTIAQNNVMAMAKIGLNTFFKTSFKLHLHYHFARYFPIGEAKLNGKSGQKLQLNDAQTSGISGGIGYVF